MQVCGPDKIIFHIGQIYLKLSQSQENYPIFFFKGKPSNEKKTEIVLFFYQRGVLPPP